MEKRLAQISKYLSFILRHEPSAARLELDAGGWIPVNQLLAALASAGRPLSRKELEMVVSENDKQRFVIRDGRIRASQGHSISVELGLEPRAPPAQLYHGTASRFLEAILSEGLRPMSRQHVHLSAERHTATKVGSRHGRPVILTVAAEAMHAAGRGFYLAENGVWLTGPVPPTYLSVPSD